MYQSLYRKYRPQTFMEIYGQDAISQTLTNAIIYDKVAHAYLFSGPRGTGKTSTAKLLAKAINCTNLVDGKICDECENCRLIRENNHPDVVEIDAASNNGVDEVRDLIEKVKYAPIKGAKKVYIIDEIHMMSQGAFNALLKTLEEPPDHVVFILATTEQHKVLQTIKSRCQKFSFKKLKEADIITCLKDILAKENTQYEEEALQIIASLCDGGMRDALSLVEQVIIYNNNEISVEAVTMALDLVAQDKISKLYELIKTYDLAKTLAYVDELNRGSVDYKQIINEIIKLAMDDLISLKSKRVEEDKQIFLLNLIEKFDESLEKLKFDNSKKLYLELAIIKSLNKQQSKIVEQIITEEYSEEVSLKIEETIISPNIQEIEKEIVVDEDDGEIIEVAPEEEIVEVDEQSEEDALIEKEVEKSIDKIANNIVDEDEIMNVLVQATRDDIEFIKSKWSLLEDYLLNVNTKKQAGLLIESIPIAASSSAIIVACRDESEVALINNQDSILNIFNFIKELTGEERYCFAIGKDDWPTLKEKYVKLKQVDRLPRAKGVLENVSLNTYLKKEEAPKVDNELLSFGKELFKDKLIVKREDDYNEY